MPLLTPTTRKTTKKFRISLDENLAKQIDHYCQYVGIQGLDDFIEQAAELVLKKDKEWRKLEIKTVQSSAAVTPNETQ